MNHAARTLTRLTATIAAGAIIQGTIPAAFASTGPGPNPGLVATTLGSPDLQRIAPNAGLVPTTLGSPDPRDATQPSTTLGLVATTLGSPDPRDTATPTTLATLAVNTHPARPALHHRSAGNRQKR